MIVTGRAAVWGTAGQLVYRGVAAVAMAQIIDSLTYSRGVQREDLRDGANELIGTGWSDDREQLAIELTPVAAATSNTIDHALRASSLPPLPARITLSGFAEPATNQINGDWMYDSPESATVKYVSGGKASVSIQLWRPKANASSRITSLIPAWTQETVEFSDRVTAAGGVITSGTTACVDEFVRTLMECGVWPKILDCGVFVGSNLTAAMAKLKAFNGTAATLTNYNFVAGDYNESGTTGGLLGNGSTKYLGTGVTPAMLGATAHMSFYLREDLDVGYPRWCMGATSAADEFRLGSSGSTNPVVIQSLYGSNQPAVSAPGAGKAFWCGVRGASTDLRLYRNGTLTYTNTTTVTPGACSREIILFGSNGPTAVYPTLNKRGSFYSMGLALTTTEAGLLYAAVQDLQSSLARTAEII